jgi:hypothetical protein
MGLGQESEQSKPPIHFFTMEVEASDTLPFLDVLIMKQGPKLPQKCTRSLLILVFICASSSTTHIM